MKRGNKDGRRGVTSTSAAQPKTRSRGKRKSVIGILILSQGIHPHYNDVDPLMQRALMLNEGRTR